MGAAKNRKARQESVNRSIWILKSLTGILSGHIENIEHALKEDYSIETMNDMRVINNATKRIDERIFADKMEVVTPECKRDYNYFYLKIEGFIDDLMSEPNDLRK